MFIPTPETRAVCDWISRMAHKYNGIVYEKETEEKVGKQWDWGQALCREIYGPGWNDDPQFKEDGENGAPFMEHVIVAIRWENGEWPEWVDRERMEAG